MPAPRLVDIDTSGSETAAFALPAQPLIVPVTQVRLRFDQALTALPGGELESPDKFRVLAAGSDDVFSTASCTAQAAGDDVAISIASVRWDAAGKEIALRLDAPTGLPRGSYRVIACDTLSGLGGLPLDGDGDGLPGGPAVRLLSIRETSHTSNPGFDDSIDGWRAYPIGVADVTLQHHAADADDASSSGALRVESPSTRGAIRLQSDACALVGGQTPAWRTRLRYRVLQGTVRVVVQTWFGFTGDAGETGCNGPGTERSVGFTAAASDAFATFDTGWRTVPGFPLATSWVFVTSTDGAPFEILFDDIGFSLDSQVIFRDDFQGH